jgi:hypothetical protein
MRLPTIQTMGMTLLLAGAGLSAAPDLFAQQTTKKLASYNAIVVERFDVEKNAATEDFPKGLDVVMQGRAVAKLRERKLFETVIDGAEAPAASGAAENKEAVKEPGNPEKTEPKAGEPSGQKDAATPSAERRLVLSSTVVFYDKGSRAARYFGGFGAGQSKVKVRFVLKDAQTNAEVLSFEKQGTFKGMFSAFGGSQEEAFTKAASGVVKALVEELIKNR